MSFCDEDLDYGLLDEVIIEQEQLTSKKEREELKQKYEDASKRLTYLEKENRILKANISSLFKTAVAEIERKNYQNNELRKELDDLILRRNKRQHEEKSCQELQEKERKRQRSSSPARYKHKSIKTADKAADRGNYSSRRRRN